MGTCSTHDGDETLIHRFSRKPEDKRPLDICRRRCNYNIKMYIKEIGSDQMKKLLCLRNRWEVHCPDRLLTSEEGLWFMEIVYITLDDEYGHCKLKFFHSPKRQFNISL
jgi:hypothetical protein